MRMTVCWSIGAKARSWCRVLIPPVSALMAANILSVSARTKLSTLTTMLMGSSWVERSSDHRIQVAGSGKIRV